MRTYLRRCYVRRLLAARYWIPAKYAATRRNERWNDLTFRRARACRTWSFGKRQVGRLIAI